MDAAFRTPLVDCFRRGEIARDVRMLAAGGSVAPRAHEQVALLMLLVHDADAEVAAAAESTLSRIPREGLAAFLARADVGTDVRGFFAARGVTPGVTPASDSDVPLLPAVGEAAAPGVPPSPDGAGGGAHEDRLGASQRLALMTVAQRIKVAMQGSREERGVLIRDPNRLVASAVLSSPKLAESEVESIARMTNVSDEVLRIVGTTRAWIKNYNVVAALVRNAKTPIAISLNLLNRLVERDVRMLSVDRNVPEPVRVQARKMFVQSQTRRQ